MPAPPPLPQGELDRLLGLLERLSEQRRIVLVGGQAVAFWSQFLQANDPVAEPGGPLASKDIDFEGSARSVRRAAVLLNGEARIPDMDDHTPNTGVVVFRDTSGDERVIDFIDAPFGLDARDVRETAVEMELERPTGVVRALVMHPERCMESRVYNAVGLRQVSPLAMRQLAASIRCAKAWSSLLLDTDDLPEAVRTRAVLRLNERVFRKCLRDRHFRRLHFAHGVDPFEAVLVEHKLLPDRFKSERYEQMQRVLADRRMRDRRNWRRSR
jgi:hypothetical protein